VNGRRLPPVWAKFRMEDLGPEEDSFHTPDAHSRMAQ